MVCLEKEKKNSFAMELVQQQYLCGVFRERKKNLLQWNLCSSSTCVVCLEKEKKNLLQWNLCSSSTCVVCLEKEKKKSFVMELVLQHFLLSILMTIYIYVAFKILEPS